MHAPILYPKKADDVVLTKVVHDLQGEQGIHKMQLGFPFLLSIGVLIYYGLGMAVATGGVPGEMIPLRAGTSATAKGYMLCHCHRCA